jgi:hypothetical protein
VRNQLESWRKNLYITRRYIAAQAGLREIFLITGGLLLSSVIVIRLFFIDMRGTEKLTVVSAKEMAEAKLLEEAG